MESTMIESYSIGSDPEGFLFDHEINRFIPAIGLIGGDKKKTRPLEKEGFAALEDNVMVEYNIPPSLFGENLKESINYATNYIEDKILNARYELRYIPSVEFLETDLQHPKALEFGCEPDMDVWLDQIRILDVANTNYRFAGGHIHFGYDGHTFNSNVKLVRLFDLALGIPSVLYDNNNRRRELYGQAGAFRFKEYGFEYRTLSNRWVRKHEDLILEQIKQAVDMYNNGFEIELLENDIIWGINASDRDVAEKLIKKYNLCTA